MGARNMRFYMKIDYRHPYRLLMNIVYKSTITNLVMMQTFEVISNKFNPEWG